MPKRLDRRRAMPRVNRQTRAYKRLGRLRHVLPILLRLKLVIPRDDRLHLLLLRVAVERRVPSEEEVGDDAHSPDVHRLPVSDYESK